MKQETLEEVAERMYGNEEDGYYLEKRAFKLGAKWQSERSYSEKEVLELFKSYQNKFPLHRGIQVLDSEFNEWFKQSKKK
jgi:hypothetical protein